MSGKTGPRRIDDLPIRLAWRLQGALNSRLQQFLNGDSLSNAAKMFYPLWNRHKPMSDSLVVMCGHLHDLTGAFKRSAALVRQTDWTVSRRSEQAELLAALYAELYEFLDRENVGQETVSVEPARDYETWLIHARDRQYLAPVDELRNLMATLRSDVAGFYLHGSIATLDYVKGWSDLDDLVIVKESTVTDGKRLAGFQRSLFRTTAQLYSFDPSQHHGHGILAEQELRHFPRTLFPPPVWRNSVRCFGSARIVLNVRDDAEDRKIALQRLVSRLQTFRIEQMNRPYVLKAYASAVMLLPSLYLQAQDVWCYKRDSFAEARGSFGAEWEAIEIASAIRQAWHEVSAAAAGRLIALPWNPYAQRAWHYAFDRLSDGLKNHSRALLPASQRFMGAITTRMDPVGSTHV